MLKPEDKIHIQNLLKALKKAKFDDFLGIEALALAKSYEWLNSLTKLIDEQESLKTIKPVEMPQVEIKEEKKKAKK